MNNVRTIITNKHVVYGMEKGKFRLTKADGNGTPIKGEHFIHDISTNFENLWTFHPDPTVDLCAMPADMLLAAAQKSGASPFFRMIGKNLIPSCHQLNDLDVVEDILMIGYPNGIWDSHNNMPVIRKGTTATHPNMDYNGRKAFLIDAACFPGSSGSPVYLYNQSGYSTKHGQVNIGGERLFFLGVLYAGPQHTATGELQIVSVSNLPKLMAVSRIPNNLGIVIKAEKILDFESVLK